MMSIRSGFGKPHSSCEASESLSHLPQATQGAKGFIGMEDQGGNGEPTMDHWHPLAGKLRNQRSAARWAIGPTLWL